MIRTLLAAAVFTAAVLVGSGARAEGEYGGKVDWVRDPAWGLVKAKIENRAAMLFFSATW